MKLKSCSVFLDLNHEVVDVDELPANAESAKRSLGQDLLEPVVVLDQLGQCALQGKRGEFTLNLVLYVKMYNQHG